MKNIATLAQEHIGKPVSKHSLLLYLQETISQQHATCRNAADFSGPKHFWVGLTQSEKVSFGLSPHFKYILVLWVKEEKDHLDCYFCQKQKFKSQHLWWYRGVLVPMALVTCTSVMAPLLLKGIQVLESHAAIQTTTFSGTWPLILEGECQDTICVS